MSDEVPVGLGRSQSEPSAMDVNDRGSLMSVRRLSPPAGCPSDSRGFKGHALWDCDPFHDVVEQTAASGSFDLAFHGCHSRSQSGCPDRILLAEGMYDCPGSFGGWFL